MTSTTTAVPSTGSSSLRKGKVKAIIYDLDGTLLDTETLSTEAIQAVVGRWQKTFTWYVCVCACRGCKLDTQAAIHSLIIHTQGDQEEDSGHARRGMGQDCRGRYVDEQAIYL